MLNSKTHQGNVVCVHVFTTCHISITDWSIVVVNYTWKQVERKQTWNLILKSPFYDKLPLEVILKAGNPYMSGESNSVGIADHNCLNFVTEIIKNPLTQEVVLYLWLQVSLLYVTGMGQISSINNLYLLNSLQAWSSPQYLT